MRRREVITLLGAAAAGWPLAAHGQASAVPVIGFLGADWRITRAPFIPALRQGVAEAGYSDPIWSKRPSKGACRAGLELSVFAIPRPSGPVSTGCSASRVHILREPHATARNTPAASGLSQERRLLHDHRVPTSRNSCMQTGLCRMRTESLAAPCRRSGKRLSDARDRTPQTASEQPFFLAETGSRPMRPRKSRVFGER
jgi:hypothetical protein